MPSNIWLILNWWKTVKHGDVLNKSSLNMKAFPKYFSYCYYYNLLHWSNILLDFLEHKILIIGNISFEFSNWTQLKCFTNVSSPFFKSLVFFSPRYVKLNLSFVCRNLFERTILIRTTSHNKALKFLLKINKIPLLTFILFDFYLSR